MRLKTRMLVVLLALGPAARSDAGDASVKGDLSRLQGRWVTRTGPRRGIVVVLDVEGRQARVDVTTPEGLNFQATGELRVDDTVTPRALDWVGFTGLDSQELPDVLGIYETDGQTLKVCNGGLNNARPSEFKHGENIIADVHVFERSKESSPSQQRQAPLAGGRPEAR